MADPVGVAVGGVESSSARGEPVEVGAKLSQLGDVLIDFSGAGGDELP